MNVQLFWSPYVSHNKKRSNIIIASTKMWKSINLSFATLQASSSDELFKFAILFACTKTSMFTYLEPRCVRHIRNRCLWLTLYPFTWIQTRYACKVKGDRVRQ